MARFSNVRAADFSARRSVRPDDEVTFNDPPVDNDPTVEVQGSLGLGGEWILRHYISAATEQVLRLEREKTGPHAVRDTAADEEEGDDDAGGEQEPDLTKELGASSHASDDGQAKQVKDVVEGIGRKDPKKPGTRRNSNARKPGVLRTPALSQISETQHEEESPPRQYEEPDLQPSIESLKRRASTIGKGTEAGRKKPKIKKLESQSTETEQSTRDTLRKLSVRNAKRQGPQSTMALDATATAVTEDTQSNLMELFPEAYSNKQARPDTDSNIVQEARDGLEDVDDDMLKEREKVYEDNVEAQRGSQQEIGQDVQEEVQHDVQQLEDAIEKTGEVKQQQKQQQQQQQQQMTARRSQPKRGPSSRKSNYVQASRPS